MSTLDDDRSSEPLAADPATDEPVARLARELGQHARVDAVFGAPVERDGVTVIPVATAAVGLGGGAAGKASGRGAGLGGGLRVTPVGYVRIANGRVRFCRIRRSWAVTATLLGLGALTVLAWTLRGAGNEDL